MNIVAILLGIVIIILVYVLYSYFTSTASTLTSYINLNSTHPAITNITNPNSTRYAYGIWIYINSYNGKNKIVFSRDSNIVVYLDQTTPTLKCDIWMSNGKWLSRQTNGLPIKITDNFPIQRWTYITISVDGQFVDSYLDGKLVVSNNVAMTDGTIPQIPPDATTTSVVGSVVTSATAKDVYVGSGGSLSAPITNTGTWDAYAAKFQRWANALSPSEVWNAYLGGNGLYGNMITNYGVNMTILKDNISQGTYQLF